MNVEREVKLAAGWALPTLGFGTWTLKEGEETVRAVTAALEAGYRSIDTAAYYGNEASVGEAIRHASVPRADIRVTTKVWNDCQGYDEALRAFDASQRRLDVGAVDLLLIHWPCPKQDKYVQTWKALERLYREGRVRGIGVSNFEPEHLDRLAQTCDMTPMVNQVQMNVLFQQPQVLADGKRRGLVVQAWRPLQKGGEVLRHPEIAAIAAKHHATTAQVALRFLLQQGAAVIAKSTHPDRMRENLGALELCLDEEDMRRLCGLDQGEAARSGLAPWDMA
jgi:2,5-diketo-D-gluconate reductase A